MSVKRFTVSPGAAVSRKRKRKARTPEPEPKARTPKPKARTSKPKPKARIVIPELPDSCFGNGELFDLTVGDTCGKYAALKEKYAELYGPFQPIQRFLEEYEMMSGDEQGSDKADKRSKRLKFLEDCAESPALRLLFMCMNGYINGCGLHGDRRQAFEVIKAMYEYVDGVKKRLSEGQAGDDKVLAAILAERFPFRERLPFRVQAVGGNVIGFFSYLKRAVLRGEQRSAELSQAFSDIDYTMVRSGALEFPDLLKQGTPPREADLVRDMVAMVGDRAPAHLVPNLVAGEGDINSGFLLFRAKTRFCIAHESWKSPKPPSASPPADLRQLYKDSRAGHLVTAQGFEEFMEGRLADRRDPAVKEWLVYLKAKKAEIALETKLNVYGIAYTSGTPDQTVGALGKAHGEIATGLGAAEKVSALVDALVRIQGEDGAWPVQGLMAYVRDWVIKSNNVIARFPAHAGWGTWPAFLRKLDLTTEIPGRPAQVFYESTLSDLENLLNGPKLYGETGVSIVDTGGVALIPKLGSLILTNFANDSETGDLVGRLAKFRANLGAPSDPRVARAVAYAARWAPVREGAEDLPAGVTLVATAIRFGDGSQLASGCGDESPQGGGGRRSRRKRRRRQRRRRTRGRRR